MAAATSVHVVAIIEPIIQHADWFFPDGKRPLLQPGRDCVTESLYLSDYVTPKLLLTRHRTGNARCLVC